MLKVPGKYFWLLTIKYIFMEVIGKIRVIEPTQEVGSNGFRKRAVVVTTEEQYPQHISVSFVQDKCDLLDNYQVGEQVKVSINLRGREWVNPQGETKYFNDIQGWRVEKLVATQPGAAQVPPPVASSESPNFEPATDFNETEHDDLPF